MRTFLALLLLLFCFPSMAMAQAGTCVEANGTHVDRAGLRKYKINTQAISSFSLTSDQAVGGTLLGADEWTEHGNAMHFQFIGLSTEADIPTSSAQCATDGVDYSLVVFSNANSSYVAYEQPRCGGKQFRIVVNAKTSTGASYNFGND